MVMKRSKKSIILSLILSVVGGGVFNTIHAMSQRYHLSDSTKNNIKELQQSISETYKKWGRNIPEMNNIIKYNFSEGNPLIMLGFLRKFIKSENDFLAAIKNQSDTPGGPIASHWKETYEYLSTMVPKLQKLFDVVKNAYGITDQEITKYNSF